MAANDSRVTPLHSAVSARHRDLAGLLLALGASANAVQQGGWTPLHTAAHNGDEAIVDLLLLRGADPTRPADDGRTPPDLADEGGHAALADMLREASQALTSPHRRASETRTTSAFASQPGSSRARVASGSVPWPSTASWKARRSKLEPSARCRLLPEPLDLALADLVGQGLSRPADVAVGLDHGVGLRQARVEELRNRALARPAEGVDAGVDDQARRPLGLPVEHAESLGRIEVQAHLVGQAF